VAQGLHNTFPEVWSPFDEINPRDRIVPIYLVDTIRSQSFHSLSGLIPLGPCGFVSRHIRLGFRPSEVFPLSQLLDLSISLTLMPLSVIPYPRAAHRAGSAIDVLFNVATEMTSCLRASDENRCTLDFRVLVRLSIRTFHLGFTPLGSRSSLGLIPLQGFQFNSWACALPSCTSSCVRPKPNNTFCAPGYRSCRIWDELAEFVHPSGGLQPRLSDRCRPG
jgi:hypothetical protein